MQRIKEVKELESTAISRCRKILEKKRISRTEEKVFSDTVQLIQAVSHLNTCYPYLFKEE